MPCTKDPSSIVFNQRDETGKMELLKLKYARSTNNAGFKLLSKGGIELESILVHALIKWMAHIFQFGSEGQQRKFRHEAGSC